MPGDFNYRAIKLVPNDAEAHLVQRGWLVAVAEMIRRHGFVDAAREMLVEAGIGRFEVTSAGLALWDVRELNRALPENRGGGATWRA